MKPLDLSFVMDANSGVPKFQVRTATAAQDAIWEAVEEAVAAGMTVEQFKSEATEAWAFELRAQAKAAAADWRRNP